MKALLYGGAFNPPTIAHIELADYVRRQLGYDKVIFMPSKGTYITGVEGKETSFDDFERYSMLNKIAANRSWMLVSDYEIQLLDQPRTYRTLQFLKSNGEFDELKLIIGSDWLDKLETSWKYIPEICKEFGIVIMKRGMDDTEMMLQKSEFLGPLSQYITLIETPDLYRQISSTKARSLLKKIQDCQRELDEILPPELNGLKG